jgi:hypothetical protein
MNRYGVLDAFNAGSLGPRQRQATWMGTRLHAAARHAAVIDAL